MIQKCCQSSFEGALFGDTNTDDSFILALNERFDRCTDAELIDLTRKKDAYGNVNSGFKEGNACERSGPYENHPIAQSGITG